MAAAPIVTTLVPNKQSAFTRTKDSNRLTLMNPAENICDFLSLLPAVRRSPNGRLQASYDEEGDVLYIHFGRQPIPATDSELTDDDIIVRYDGENVIGITILHASLR